MESEPIFAPREKSPLPEKILLRGGSNLRRCIKQDSKPNTHTHTQHTANKLLWPLKTDWTVWLLISQLNLLLPKNTSFNQLCSVGRLVGHANFSTKFYHTCLAYTYHWLPPFYTTSTLPWGHKVSGKQSLLDLFSCIPFNWSGWNLICHRSNLSWTSW